MARHGKRKLRAIIILPVAFLFLHVTGALSQGPLDDLTISLRTNARPLYNVLDEITDQTGYYFTFDSRLIDSRKEITIQVKNAPLRAVLDTLVGDPNLQYRVINKNVVIYPYDEPAVETRSTTDTLRGKKYVETRGTITDSRSGKPLQFATIAVLDAPFGTISNEDGSFMIRLPDSLKNPILVTSFIGYRNQYTPVSISSDEPVKIPMTKKYISLQEVIIRYQDPGSLLQEAIQRIDDNYITEPFGARAYYRERVKKDDKCMLFSEAVVDIAKSSYNSSITADRSRLLKGRKITNISQQDTVILKIRSGMNTMLQLDIIKNLPDFLSGDVLSRYNLSYTNVVTFRDQLVYVISFSPREYINETLFKGEIYIDRKSLAILAADFQYDPLKIGREQDMFVSKKSSRLKLRPLSASYHVEYANTGGKYHLSQVQGSVVFKVKKRRQWISSKYQINLEMAVTQISPGEPPDIKASEMIKPSVVMSDQEFVYDPEFWGSYNTIEPEASLKEALEQITKSMQEISTR